MKAIVLGGGADQCSLIQELRYRGFNLILIDYYQNPPAKMLVDKHYVTSTLDQEAVLEICDREKADIVITACTDQALLTVAHVSEKLGLNWPFTFKQSLETTNKAFMKSVFLNNNIPTSEYLVVTHQDDLRLQELPFPLVVKPSDSNGSFGIKKADNYLDLNSAVINALAISRSKKVVVEKYIQGMELSIDAFIKNGDTHILLITETKKIPSKEGAFPISESLYPVNLTDEIKNELKIIVSKMCAAFCLDNTPLLVQVVLDDEDIYVLEFGVRIAGGSKHHLIKCVTGFDVMKAFVSSILQEPFQIITHESLQNVATIYIYGKPGVFSMVSGLEELINENSLNAFYQYKTPGMRISENNASRDRIGACLVEAPNTIELNKKLNRIDETFKVLDDKGIDIMLHGIYSIDHE